MIMALDIETDWGGLLELAARPSPWTVGNGHGAHSSHESRKAFTGTSTYADALDLLRNGWAEGREQIVRGITASGPIIARSRAKMMDVAGAYPIVPMAVAGEPACMVNHGVDDTPRPHLRMVVGVNFLASIHKYTVINRGVAICRVIDALEQAGTRIELIAAWDAVSDNGKDGRFRASVIVKETDQPLELDRIAFVFAHPSMNRRIGFHLRELTKPQHAWNGYGTTRPIEAVDYPDSAIIQQVTPGNQSEFENADRAFRIITEQMMAAGIEIAETP